MQVQKGEVRRRKAALSDLREERRVGVRLFDPPQLGWPSQTKGDIDAGAGRVFRECS